MLTKKELENLKIQRLRINCGCSRCSGILKKKNDLKAGVRIHYSNLEDPGSPYCRTCWFLCTLLDTWSDWNE